jgi:hypothetical protein
MRLCVLRAMSRAIGVAAIMVPCVAGTSLAGSSLRLTIAPVVVIHPVVHPKVLGLAVRDAASGLPTGKRMHKPLTLDVQR